MNANELAAIAALIRGQRQAALGTLDAAGTPFVSLVAYAAEPGFAGMLLHLSGLSPHTGQLIAAPRCSLLVSEPDDARDDPQTLARITLLGHAAPLPRDGDDFAAARACYLDRLPAAQLWFDFADFTLFRFVPAEARFVGGFARAYSLTAARLREAADL